MLTIADLWTMNLLGMGHVRGSPPLVHADTEVLFTTTKVQRIFMRFSFFFYILFKSGCLQGRLVKYHFGLNVLGVSIQLRLEWGCQELPRELQVGENKAML